MVLGIERVADGAATRQAADSGSMDTIEALALSRGESLVPVSFFTLLTTYILETVSVRRPSHHPK